MNARLVWLAAGLAAHGACSGCENRVSTTPAGCGDGVASGTDVCDGADLAATTCADLGFASGALACAPDCAAFDTAGCIACVNDADCGAGRRCASGSCVSARACGDGVLSADEPCDGPLLDSATCATRGWVGGTLACAGDCSAFDESGCHRCGNAVADAGEDCDGDDLGGRDCQDLGAGAGSLVCTPACTFDTSSCGSPVELGCADGIDNDGDGDPDCADLDCAAQLCDAGQPSWTCRSDLRCGPDAAVAFLVRDFNTQARSPTDARISDYGATATMTFFTAYLGEEYLLWRTDGTPEGTLPIQLLASGGPGAEIDTRFFAPVGNALLFTSGHVVWRTDGTSAGTARLRPDLRVSIYDRDWTIFGGRLYFPAEDGAGVELWRTDGTDGGTERVIDLCPGADPAYPYMLEVFAGRVHFIADDCLDGFQLWSTDGTEAGTALVFDPVAGPSGFLSDLEVAGGKLWAVAGLTDGFTYDADVEPYSTDGVAAVARVADLNPGSPSSGPSWITDGLGAAFFLAASPSTGLYVSDGTGAGTTLLGTFESSGGPGFLEPLASLLLFTASPVGVSNAELWVTDGTVGGTTQVLEINAAEPSHPHGTTRVGDVAVFSANDGVHGRELWVTDGTTTNTRLLADIVPGAESSDARIYLCCGERVRRYDHLGRVPFVTMSAGQTGQATWSANELWVTDGTAPGTIRLRAFDSAAPSWPNTLGEWNGDLYFTASDGISSHDLWRTDGTAAGTQRVWVNPIGTLQSASLPGLLDTTGPRLIFAATDATGSQLWSTDGTTAGTSKLTNLTSDNGYSLAWGMLTLGATRLFSARTGSGPYVLWATDGTTGGTAELSAGVHNPAVSEPYAVVIGGIAYFRGNDAAGATGGELWRSDGTAGGTRLVVDLRPGSESSSPMRFTPLGSRALFSANDGTTGFELWVTDGTAGGTTLVMDINPGAADSWPLNHNFAYPVIGSRACFVADDGTHGRELWCSDGTPGGTALVRDIAPGAAEGFPLGLAVYGGRLYFTAETAGEGRELWSSDGTPGGTALVVETLPGPATGSPGDLVPLGSGKGLAFTAADAHGGRELWWTDGTRLARVQDIAPGIPGSNPRHLRVAGAHLYFRADVEPYGSELWAVPLAAFPLP